MVIRLKVPIEMHYTVIPMGTSKVNSSHHELLSARISITASSATAQSQVNRITTGTSKVNVSP